MTKEEEKIIFVQCHLSKDSDKKALEFIKEHHSISNNSDLVKFLIKKEFNSLQL